MDSLISQIETIISSSILNFNMKVAKKYNIDIAELNELWATGGSETESQSSPVSQPIKLTKSMAKNTTPLPVVEKSCPYSFSRGPNSGTVCGTKIKGEGNYCSRHKQYENKEQKGPKKVLPQPKKSAPTSDEDDEEEQRVREELNKKKTEGYSEKEISYMFFKKPELGANLSFHKQTGFVCNEKKLIVGKKTNDNKVVPLTEEDIKVAKSWNFNVKQSDMGESKVETLRAQTVASTPVASTPVASTPKVVQIVKPPIITKGSLENKAQETKVQEKTSTLTKTLSSTVKKFVVPAAKLTTTKIEKSSLPIKDTVSQSEKKEKVVNHSLNEEAKNTKKTISKIIEQQKDLEDILDELTKGDEEVEENDEGSLKGSDEEDEDVGDDIQEEDEIFEDE